MKTRQFVFSLLSILIPTLSGCAVIGDIFKAGMFVGVLAVVLIIGLIIFIVKKTSSK
jgi:hypothetical protein